MLGSAPPGAFTLGYVLTDTPAPSLPRVDLPTFVMIDPRPVAATLDTRDVAAPVDPHTTAVKVDG